jgi:hypothetical protein
VTMHAQLPCVKGPSGLVREGNRSSSPGASPAPSSLRRLVAWPQRGSMLLRHDLPPRHRERKGFHGRHPIAAVDFLQRAQQTREAADNDHPY